MKPNLRLVLLLAALPFCTVAAAQPPVLIHSHNDYARRVPFYQAFAQQVNVRAINYLYSHLYTSAEI